MGFQALQLLSAGKTRTHDIENHYTCTHTTLGWHTHPMPNAAYVVSGHLTIEKQSDGSKKKVYAGETVAETVATVHRGFTDDEPVTLIVFYAGEKSLPLSTAVTTFK